jgi:hypothetical protein
MVRAEGSAGNTLYVSGAVPPVPVTGVNAVAATPAVSVVVGMAVVAVTTPLTVRVKVAVAVALFASFTVTV